MLLILPLLHAADDFEGYRFYYGDPHAHTSVSGDGASEESGCTDGCGRIDQVFVTAKNNGLDWLALTDHINGIEGQNFYPTGDETQYNELFQRVLLENDENGGFITVPAAEVWFRDLKGHAMGHKTLLMFGGNAELTAASEASLQFNGGASMLDGCDAIWEWAQRLQDNYGAVLLVPHHPAMQLPMPTDWNCHSSDFEPAVEVYSEHGTSIWSSFAYDPPVQAAVEVGTAEAALDPNRFGLRMGFIAGTDSHDTNPGSVCTPDIERLQDGTGGGLTVAVLPEGEQFSRNSLYMAMRNRATYATTGPEVPMLIRYRSLGVLLGEMGQDLAVPEGQPLEVELRIPAEYQPWVMAVQIFSESGVVSMEETAPGTYAFTYDFSSVPAYLYPSVALDGAGLYGGTCEDGGNNDTDWLWSSPSWIEVVSGDQDGDGWSWSQGDCREGDPSISPGAAEIWYDGIDQNCDGQDDDQDGDGFGIADDCDDLNPGLSPDVREIWYDGIDQNCDGNDDDQDADHSPLAEDCDDDDPARSPLLSEIWYDGIDQDCDGNDQDQDQDGFDLSDDCDDENAEIGRCKADGPSDPGGCGRGGAALLLLGLGRLRGRRRPTA